VSKEQPTLGQLCEMHRQIESGRITRENLQAFLRNPNQYLTGFRTMTVTLGTHQNAEGYRHGLNAADCSVNGWACDILDRIAFSFMIRVVNLVVCSAIELGFAKGATSKDICEAGKRIGLRLCPAEVGPALRLQYRDQPVNESLVIAMDPVVDWNCDSAIFKVEHEDNPCRLCLSTIFFDSGYLWETGYSFVFMSGK